MKARILELIINPESIANEDLSIIKEEIAIQPYAQSLRALYLLGIKKYNVAEFQKELSTTAAYTTDKKVLYQFINREKYEVKVPIIDEDITNVKAEEITMRQEEVIEKIIMDDAGHENEANWQAEIPEKEIPIKIEIDGVVNRILFEGEENFLDEENDSKIDLEATAESGVLVTEKVENGTNEILKPLLNKEKSPEEFKFDLLSIKSEILPTEIENRIESTNDLKVVVSEKETEENLITREEKIIVKEKAPENKYEIERKKLAEEIERKMSLSKKNPQTSPDKDEVEEQNATVDFFHTQEFSIKNEPSQNSEDDLVLNNNLSESPEIVEETENSEPENAAWKPMQEIEKKASRFKKEEISENIFAENETENIDEKIEEKLDIQPLDISFFTPEISPIKKEEIAEKPTVKVTESEKSNVPVFINTWQNWLKIDRVEDKIEENTSISNENAKLNAIEKFIDSAPKISKFKEDNDYKIPEKKDDITHLMTETLANLFWTQKLYSKAINAYKILGEKHPEKLDYYNAKIDEIQATRQK